MKKVFLAGVAIAAVATVFILWPTPKPPVHHVRHHQHTTKVQVANYSGQPITACTPSYNSSPAIQAKIVTLAKKMQNLENINSDPHYPPLAVATRQYYALLYYYDDCEATTW